MKLFLNDELGDVTLKAALCKDPKAVIIISHGAGAGMDHPFLVSLARELSANGVHAIRFNFPYMEQGRKSPGSPKKNIQTWQIVTDHISNEYPDLPIFLSGKSYGGRMASHMIADATPDSVKGIVYYGFPLHAPGRDSKERADHLGGITLPQLFLQGTKDKLANISLMEEVTYPLKSSTLIKIEGGDHSFNVPKSVGLSKDEVIKSLANHSIKFIQENL